MRKLKLLIISNYPPDNQQSMAKFSAMLDKIYAPLAQTTLVHPPIIATRLPLRSPIISKYLAYIDKLFFFPIWLVLNSWRYNLIHIADHGNSFYSFLCPRQKTLVTCHDLLAVRGAMGDPSASCQASPLGPFLQRLILLGLGNSSAIAFVSQATYRDYISLQSKHLPQRHQVIPNTLNARFTYDINKLNLTSAEYSILPSVPYLLMVGSALPRKNRKTALKILCELSNDSDFKLVFAGAPLTQDESSFQSSHIYGRRLISIAHPSHELLNMLYCNAYALLFPSLSEGFGWPLIEAQASGCPVIASNTTCIPEVAGSGALYSDPLDVSQFIHNINILADQGQRSILCKLGFENLKRFDYHAVASSYHSFSGITQ